MHVTTPYSVCMSGCSEVPRSKFQLRGSSHVAQDHCRTRPKWWVGLPTPNSPATKRGFCLPWIFKDPWEKQMTEQNNKAPTKMQKKTTSQKQFG